MKRTNRILALALSVMMLLANIATPVSADTDKKESRKVRIEFTSDMHSHIDISSGEVCGKIRERGGMSRLSTLLKQRAAEFKDGDTIYLDGGDFSQGTLFQTGYIS